MVTIQSKLSRSSLLTRFVVFAGIGVVGTGCQYLVLVASVHWLKVEPVLGSSVGFLVGALVNYLLNYRLTFRSSKRHSEALSKFLVVAAMGMALNGALMAWSVHTLHLHYLIGQVIATIIVLVWNFLGNYLWTFRENAHATGK